MQELIPLLFVDLELINDSVHDLLQVGLKVEIQAMLQGLLSLSQPSLGPLSLLVLMVQFLHELVHLYGFSPELSDLAGHVLLLGKDTLPALIGTAVVVSFLVNFPKVHYLVKSLLLLSSTLFILFLVGILE
eukprot:CAMPEP_0170562696 /NCGR_PEP_ID=MMETSP0211-20121228/61993_1 /TAXON_ID=311385 /ORGANISM="Pseudokeronopsis sp., Strain OXSARD2" /LENGTH=130 /DNA_ID=CAMNT_0010879927 /DNA_START=267 /DNA_END=659 /DNA_ORIENTATION=+